MASKALLMSIVINSDRFGGLLELMPSFIFCVRLVNRVVVEWFGLYPCCVGDSGMNGVVILRIKRSTTLEGVQRSVMGL